MEDYATLYQNGEYQKILDLTKSTQESDPLFYRAASFLALKQPKEAYEVLKSNRSILFAARPEMLLKYTFETLFVLRDFDTAYADLKEFENYPYVSQQIEEILRALPKKIREEEISSYKSLKIDEDELLEILKKENSISDEALLGALGKAMKISPSGELIERIQSILVSSRPHYVKSFALMILVNAGVKGEFPFLSKNGLIKIDVQSLKLPFEYPEYQMVLKELSFVCPKDPSLLNGAKSIFEQYALEVYPERIGNQQIELLASALAGLSKTYLRSTTDLSLYSKEHGLDQKDIESKMNEIEDTLRASLPNQN